MACQCWYEYSYSAVWYFCQSRVLRSTKHITSSSRPSHHNVPLKLLQRTTPPTPKISDLPPLKAARKSTLGLHSSTDTGQVPPFPRHAPTKKPCQETNHGLNIKSKKREKECKILKEKKKVPCVWASKGKQHKSPLLLPTFSADFFTFLLLPPSLLLLSLLFFLHLFSFFPSRLQD